MRRKRGRYLAGIEGAPALETMVAALAAGLVAMLTAGDAVAAQVAKTAIRGEVDGVTGTCSTRSMPATSRTLSRVELDATSGSPSRVTPRSTRPLGLSGIVKVTVEGQGLARGSPVTMVAPCSAAATDGSSRGVRRAG